MLQNPKRTAALWFLFISGVVLASGLWSSISLPFQNPMEVVGYCTRIRFNPQNDLLRFLFFVSLPGVLLIFFYRWIPARRYASAGKIGLRAREESWSRLVPLLAFVVLISLNVPTYHSFGRFDSYHEGESLGTAVAHLAGETPYRDYFFFHGPIQDPLRSAWAFQLFGRSIGSQRTWESLMKLSAWVFLALFLRRLFGNSGRAAMVLMVLAVVHVSFAFNVFYFLFLPSYQPSDVGEAFLRHRGFFDSFQFLILPARDVLTYAFLWAFLGVKSCLDGKEKAARSVFVARVFLFSFFPILALGYSADRGVYLSAVFIFLFSAFLFLFTREGTPRLLFVLGAGLGAVCAFGMVAWLLRGNVAGFLGYLLMTLSSYKELSEKLPFPLMEWKFLLAIVLLAAHLFLLVLAALRQRGAGKAGWLEIYGKERLIELGLFFMSVLFFRNVLARSEEEHLFYGMGPLLILTLYSGFRFFREMNKPAGRFWPPAKGWILTASFVTAFLCLLRCCREDILLKNFPIHVPDGHFVPQADQKGLDFLAENMKKDDLFFTLTSEAAWYYYLNQPCPTRFPYVWVAAPRNFQEEIVRDLRAKKVKWVLFKDDDWSYSIDGIPNDEKFQVVAAYLRENYRFFKAVAGREFWVLKDG